MEASGSPESCLPEIKEHPPSSTNPLAKARPNPLSTFTSNTTTTTTTVVVSSNILHTPTTPRIDISRASSSSHHDSRDSSPENVFDQVGDSMCTSPLIALYFLI